MKTIRLIIIILIFILSSNCSKNRNIHLSKKQQKFVHVYSELLQLQNIFHNQNPAYLDSSRKILEKYKFTKNEYERSLAYFNKNPERWELFYQTILNRLKENETNQLP
jgi:hypothetical protein